MKPNRLRGSACYLAGPMSACSDNGCEWRDRIRPILKDMGVVVLDPTQKRIAMGDETAEIRDRYDKLRKAGYIDEYRDFVKTIRRVDLRMIDLASFVIVRLDGTPTVGTWEELATAVREQKPTLVWLDGDLNMDNVNGWLLSQMPLEYFFESWDKLHSYLKGIDQCTEHPTDRRWMLFDFAEMYREILS